MLKSLEDSETPREIKSFGEIVGTLSHQSLSVARTSLRIAAMSKECERLDEDSPFYKTRKFSGLHRRLVRCLDELEGWELDSQGLRRVAVECEPRLRDKLSGLGNVADATWDVLRRIGKVSNAARMRSALDGDTVVIRNPVVLVLGSTYEPVLAKWIKWAVKGGNSLTIVVDWHPTAPDLYRGARRLEADLGVQAEEVTASNALSSSIFSESQSPGLAVEVRIQSAPDPLYEAEFVVRECARRLGEGADPTSLAVFARNLDDYTPSISLAARRFGVPLSMPRRVPLLTNGLAQVVLQSIKYCAGNDVRAIIELARSTYFRLDPDTFNDLVAGAKDAFRAGSGQWDVLAQWAALDEDRYKWLTDLLAWRSENVREAQTLRDWVDRVYELGALPWNANSVDSPVAVRDDHAKTALIRPLSEHASVELASQTKQYSLNAFASLCERLWDDETVTIPSEPGGVQVTSSAAAIRDVETLFVLGLLEGVFPRRRSEDPILSDADREAISAIAGGPALPSSFDVSAEERDEFHRLCSAAGSKLILSYPLTQEDRDNVPAFYLTEVERAVPEVIKIDLTRQMLTGTPEYATDADLGLRAAQAAPKDPAPDFDIVTEEAALAIAPRESPAYSARDFRRVLECPFQFVMRSRLGLRPSDQGLAWFALANLPSRGRLYSLADEESAEASLGKALEEFLDETVADLPAHEHALLRTGGKRLVAEWVEREFNARKIWNRDPEKVVPLVTMGGSDGMLAGELTFGGQRTVRLRGTVPAVSRSAGQKTVHLTQQVVRGELEDGELEPLDKLELGIYLFAAHEPSTRLAIEVDTLSGKRTLYALPRGALRADAVNKLAVFDLEGQPEFFKGIKEKLYEALDKFAKPTIEATPGFHCQRCEYGELCRLHRDFGEVIDPFEFSDEGGDQ